MIIEEKELQNVINSLKYWDVSDGQKDCVIKLVNTIRQLKIVNKDIEDNLDFYYTTLLELGKISIDKDKKEKERLQEIYKTVKSIINPDIYG